MAGQSCLLSGDGSLVEVHNSDERAPCDVLVLSGERLREPVALGGSIVMNTEQEVDEAMRDLRDGSFLHKRRGELV